MHLLLEGDRGSGKSTLLLEAIRPLLHQAGGFGTVRLLDEANRVRGYAQVPAAELEQVNQSYREGRYRLFAEKAGERMISHPEVLVEQTLPMLVADTRPVFYLLDEIGGVEILLPAWQERLREIFSGDIPSIGVWKSPANCMKFRRNVPGFEAVYWEMREWLQTNPAVQFLQVTEENHAEVTKEIQNWKNCLSQAER